MAKPSSNAAPAFKAVAYKAPALGVRRAATTENYPVPVYLVMRTDWRFSKRSGRHQQQTTTVVSAFTTLLPAQEAALIAFEKFVNEYHYAGERSVENRFSWYSWWNGRNKAHYRDVKEISEDMKTWPSKWKGGTAEESYDKMVEAMEAVKSRLPSGSIFNVEKASLPPSARNRAVNSTSPVPFRIFVVTENHWSWSKSVDVTTVLSIFTCLNQARAEGVDAYHAYIHSSHQERKRLKWDKTSSNAYDRMLKNVLADKITWEKTSREYGTSFSIDECYCYPRGAFFRHQDEVLPKAEEVINFSMPGGDSSLSSVLRQAPPAPSPAPTPSRPVEQVIRANVAPSAPSVQLVQKEKPYIPVVQSTDQDGPRAHGFIRRTYAVNPEKKKEDRDENQGIEAGTGVGLRTKGILHPTRGSHPLGMHRMGAERVRFRDRGKENGRDAGGASTRFGSSIRSTDSTRFGSRHDAYDDDDQESREGRGVFPGEEDAGLKRRKTWNDKEPDRDEVELESDHHGQDVAQAWAQAGARARARRVYTQDEELGEGPEEGDRNERENIQLRKIHQDNVVSDQSESVVYHRAYSYVASDKWRNELPDERKDELTSEGERADDEISVQTIVHRRVYQRGWIDGQAEVHDNSGSCEVQEDNCEVEYTRPNETSGLEDEEEAFSEVDNEHRYPVTGESCEDGNVSKGDDHSVEKSEGEVDEAWLPVDDQPPDTCTGVDVGDGRTEVRDPFHDPLENEKTESEEIVKGHCNPFDDPLESDKTGEEDEEVCAEVVDEAEDPPLVRKPRKPDEKISKYLDDQLECLFTGRGYENEILTEGYGYQPQEPVSVPKLGRSEELHFKEVPDCTECPGMNAGLEDSKCDDALQKDRFPMKTTGSVEDFMAEEVEGYRGYIFTSVDDDGANHAEGDDPPLIRKSRGRKERGREDDWLKGEVCKSDAYQHTDHREYDFTSGGYAREIKVKCGGPRPIRKSGEQREVRSQVDDRLRREAHHRSDHQYYSSIAHESWNSPKCGDIPSLTKPGEARSKGDDWLGGQSAKREARSQAEGVGDCEVEQLEDESMEEKTVGRRKEAPHLDLALKRHRALMKEDDESPEEDFGGRRPVGGGFKIPS